MRRSLTLVAHLLIALLQAAVSQQTTGTDVTPLLLPGLGKHHHAISTKSAEAQKYFDQGLMLVIGFNRAEAVRSFRRAAQLDSEAAMPYWGMALAYGRHMNMDWDMDVQPAKAFAAIQQALALSTRASEVERLYIQALAQRCSENHEADGRALDAAYAASMSRLAASYPDDMDAAAFSLEAKMMVHRYEWFHDDMPQEGTSDLIRQIEDVLRRDPDHPLANHLYIHLLDTGHPEMALGSAYRLGHLTPGLGHLVHMSSHIFFNLGDYEMTARVNAQAAAAEREYMKLANPGYNVYTLAYYLHDLHFVSRARAEQGLFEEAKSYADQVADYVRPVQDQWPMISDYYLPVPLLVLLRFQRWDDLLRLPEPQANRKIGDGLWHFGRAMAFAAKGQREKALAEKKALASLRQNISGDAMWMLNTGQSMLSLASLVLDARLAQDQERSIEIWRQAVKAQDNLAYDEPPAWYYPIRESLGAALLRAGKANEAETVFRECLRGNPRDPRALFGLMQSVKAENNMDAVEWVRNEFESSWKNPDLHLRLEDF